MGEQLQGQLETAARAKAEQLLLSSLDSRMGNVLFIGAGAPSVAHHVLKRGLFLTVLDSQAGAADALLAEARSEKLERNISVDMRPYENVEFQGSSYNAVIAWNGIPNGMAPALFFKKVRRELKAGASVFLLTTVTPRPVLPEKLQKAWSAVEPRLPGPAVGLVEKGSKRLEQFLDQQGQPDAAALVEAASQFLKHEQTVPLAGPLSMLAALMPGFLKAGPLTNALAKACLKADDKVLTCETGASYSGHVLVKCSKSLEFGKVFRV